MRKLSFVLAIILLLSASPVFAMTEVERQSAIQSIQAQLVILYRQLSLLKLEAQHKAREKEQECADLQTSIMENREERDSVQMYYEQLVDQKMGHLSKPDEYILNIRREGDMKLSALDSAYFGLQNRYNLLCL